MPRHRVDPDEGQVRQEGNPRQLRPQVGSGDRERVDRRSGTSDSTVRRSDRRLLLFHPGTDGAGHDRGVDLLGQRFRQVQLEDRQERHHRSDWSAGADLRLEIRHTRYYRTVLVLGRGALGVLPVQQEPKI